MSVSFIVPRIKEKQTIIAVIIENMVIDLFCMAVDLMQLYQNIR